MNTLPYDVSSTDEDSIISMWLNDIESTSLEREQFRNWRVNNTVQWCTRKDKTQAIAVYRLNDKKVNDANTNYINSGVILDRVYTVVLKQHKQTVKTVNGKETSVTIMQNRVLATVGQDSNSAEFYLLSNAKLSLRKRIAGGSDLETLERAISTINKAMRIADEHGIYDNSYMYHVDDMASVASERPNVSRKVTNFGITAPSTSGNGNGSNAVNTMLEGLSKLSAK